MRWLRGEYPTRTEARAALGVGSIIDDGNWYEHLKLMGVFFRRIGYAGFLVILDECVNLYKISNRVSRENNYEKLLSMFNDALQGKAQGLMMLLGGTPQFLEDGAGACLVMRRCAAVCARDSLTGGNIRIF